MTKSAFVEEKVSVHVNDEAKVASLSSYVAPLVLMDYLHWHATQLFFICIHYSNYPYMLYLHKAHSAKNAIAC